MSRSWIVGLAALAAIGSPTRAEDAATPKGPFVVLVGVGQFVDPAIDARPTADADARALYQMLSDKKYLDAGPERVVLLTSQPNEKAGERKATRDNIVKAFHEAVEKTSKEDMILFAYFGRGASVGDKTCFFTTETIFKERAKTGLLGSDLEADLKAAQSRRLCLLFDVAFKGFDAGKEAIAEPTLRDLLTAVYGGDDQREGPPPPDKLVVLSATPSHVPLTKGDHGLFYTVAVEALQGVADTEGGEADGLVTVDEFMRYVEFNLAEQVRQIGKTSIEKESVPFFIGEETSHFPITKNPKVTGKVEARLKALAELEKNSKISKDVADEGKQLLTRMPKLKAHRDLRKQYQELADGKLEVEKFAFERGRIKEGMELAGDEAETYARNTLAVIETVRQKYVKELPAGDWAAMAVKGLYRRLEQPIPDEVNEKLKNSKALSRTQIQDLLKTARVPLGKREDLDAGKDVDTSTLMMFAELRDPYSTYYDKDTLKKMDAPLRGEFRGVGIHIRRDLVRDGLLVVSPIKGSPAYQAGIQAGDLIVKIKRETNAQGEPLRSDEPKEISTRGMKTEQALDIILGKPGIPVTLVVDREGEKEPKEFTIKRGVVSVETVLGVKRDEKDEWSYSVDPESKIGYVQLTQFAPSTARDLNAAILKMKKNGLKGLVLDLRFNPGGLLTQAVAVSDLFIDDGLIVTVKYRYKESEEWYDRGLANYADFPMAVLVNGSSASAAEIVSAALRDHGRAIIVGERTYGKGSVQNVEDVYRTGGQIKLTTARYFPPKGWNIDKLSTSGKEDEEWGVRPDKGFEVKLTREETQDLAEQFRDREVIKPKAGPAKEPKPFKDRQLDKAVEYLKSQTRAASNPGK
jgi:C-terminal peptidase prc